MLQSLVDTFWSWSADESESAAAEVGWSVGPDVYASLEPRMVKRPTSAAEAHEQAVYFLSIAARRADYENEKDAQSMLVAAKRKVELDKADIDVPWSCDLVGLGCGLPAGVKALSYAEKAVAASGLNWDDTEQISAQLRSNKRALQLRIAAPWLAAVALVGTVVWWRRKP